MAHPHPFPQPFGVGRRLSLLGKGRAVGASTPGRRMPRLVAIAFCALALCAVGLGATGCAERPGDLARQDNVDELCSDGKVAYSYALKTDDGKRTSETLLEPAIDAGCVAPIGAWTDVTDQEKEGVRKTVFELRHKENRTVLCCP